MYNYDPSVDGPEAKDLFDIVYKDIKFDKSLYKKLHRFRLSWIRKSPEYSEFLGGNTLGLQDVRFSTRDDHALMVDIFNVDKDHLRTNIIKLPDIDASWNVSTNPVLQTLCYTMHRFIVDGKMGNKLEDALQECYYIFSYKVFGSLLSSYFKHKPTPAVAKATYEGLSNRYLIKRLGSWDKVLDHRSNAVVPKKGLHTERLITYTTDDAVRIVNDLQGGIREHIKAIYGVMMDITAHNSIRATSLLSKNDDSEESSRDLADRPDKYIQRLRSAIGSRASLIDEDFIYLINSLVKASDIDIIRTTLTNLSNEYDPREKEASYIDNIVLKTIAYCNTKGISGEYRSNITMVISLMRGYWTSGSVRDKDVTKVKKVIERAVKKSTHRKTRWVISANTTAVIIYLFVRSIK